MIPLTSNIWIFPVLHGSAPVALALRRHLLERSYQEIWVPWPNSLQSSLEALVDELPVIHALVLQQGEQRAYIPADPCDAYIEAIRQTRQSPARLRCIGPERLPNPRSALSLPDPWVLEGLDFRAWVLSQWPYLAIREEEVDAPDYFAAIRDAANHCTLPTLLLCHLTELPSLFSAFKTSTTAQNGSAEIPEPMHTSIWPIKPQHLYFALGETPYLAGYCEQNRQDPFADLPSAEQQAKHLLQCVRDIEENGRQARRIPPSRLQAALTYLRKLSAQEQRRQPDLFEWVTATKGTLGDSFASHLIEFSQSYPFDPPPEHQLRLGLDRLRTPLDPESVDAWNILRDLPRTIRIIQLRRDPRPEESKRWKYSWNPSQSCSHIPEDFRIERFNTRARAQTLRTYQARNTRSVPFTSSLLDGIDLRATLRHWHRQELWVREIPPSQGKTDTVIMLFDQDHDDRYPYHCTWFAEHIQESTLSFYSTDPFADMIGPGIARARYGGLALLFPPKHIPELFNEPCPEGFSLAERLVYGALRFSQERLVGILSEQRPNLRMREMARHMGKHLVWTPLSHYPMETIESLRTLHILNGHEVRSIASRYIRD